VIPDAIGQRVTFVEGEGPKLDPIDADGLARLSAGRLMEHLGPVLETVERVRAALPEERTLIGFCGAPWTVATYMINGGGSSDHAETRLAAARDPALVDRLVEILVDASASYLIGQLKAGADVVQIFDSWAGVLGEREFERWCIGPTTALVSRIRAAIPGAKIIGFPKGAALRLAEYVTKTGVDAVGIDWTTPLDYARDVLKPKTVVQGNLDPMVLVAGGSGLDAEIDRIMTTVGGGRFIFNLGHGIVPQTPIPHVEQLIARVRQHEGRA
jgi:uroporphyrinogen decarboxylase